MSENIKKQIAKTVESHKRLVDEAAEKIETIAEAAEVITRAIRRNGRIYVCGNGGSAADAQHIAGELVGRFVRERKGLPAIALTTDTSVITSISNDYGYENVYARQVEALVKKGDVLWAISTSGKSANILKAVRLAKKKGAVVVAFTGIKDSQLERMADVCFCANDKSTARSQEIHQLAYHIICDIVEQNFA